MITSFEKKKHLTKDYTYKSSIFYILATNDRKLKILQNSKVFSNTGGVNFAWLYIGIRKYDL